MNVVQVLLLTLLGVGALRLSSIYQTDIKVKSHGEKATGKIPIWVYYDTHNYKKEGSSLLFGNLTFELMQQRIDPDEFELKFVNAKNVKEHLPDCPEEFFRLYDAAKSDFLRSSLIAKHGGIYLDGDIMVNEDFHALWQELDKQRSDAVVYLSPGQSCHKEFTTNFMMGRKGNDMSVKWSEGIISRLKSKCPGTPDHDDTNRVCCYNPDGSARKECHVPWGEISRPFEQGVTFKKNSALYSVATASHACIGADMGMGIDDDTGMMLWANEMADDSSTKSEDACWMEGTDLTCKNGKKMRNFFKRTGYHLYSSINYKYRQQSRDELLFGRNKTVARALFRHLLLGEDIFDTIPNGKCIPASKVGKSFKASEIKHMEFIHIPRTGGTAVEECTGTAVGEFEKWGVQNPALQGLHKITEKIKMPRYGNSCYKQHMPPSLLKPEESPYVGKETFCIVRNPYTKIVSQFKFELAFYKQPTVCNAEQLNELIKRRLTDVVEENNKFQADCHWTPQAFYVYGVDPETLSLDVEQRSCNNVLTFGNPSRTLEQAYERSQLSL